MNHEAFTQASTNDFDPLEVIRKNHEAFTQASTKDFKEFLDQLK